ncbi:IclR family transcriptional regulator [Carbonactinospora thermoautotrophica]|uniref:IclR family transcriptional regulator n=1 Tax=Carbonactinospora thermoautotrophica TaxID=1469144 RepID=UPI002271BDA1|nr:IclR family transcriptional regulator [Carbonactinospora thermoautotrophica]MCX9191542.1 IclR family transcriptional regulator [Carbonactinospora thermoautotrophica]
MTPQPTVVQDTLAQDTAKPPRNGTDGGLRSVLAALDLLDCFASADELGVSEIARRLGLAKSTVHRLLTTLCARGLAEKNPQTCRYRLGFRLYELGQLAISRFELRQAALPLLEELRERTGCTIHLAIPDGADIVYVERLQTLRGMRLMTNVSRRLPAHCTSSGKAIAAFDPAVAQARRAAGFPQLTSCSIRSAADYDRELEAVRRTGYAVNHDEALVGLSAVAAPVRDREGRARAAISLVGLTREIEGAIERNARLAQAAANKLARTLCL